MNDNEIGTENKTEWTGGPAECYKIPPIEITSDNFDEHVDKERSPRAKASEMEHALRYHIRKHLDEDPAFFQKLSDRLETILKEFKGNWEEMVKALKKLVEEAKKGRQKDDDTGLDPETQAPFFDLLQQELVGNEKVTGRKRDKLCALTVELVDHIRQEISIVGFWSRTQAGESLSSWIFMALDDADLLPFDKLLTVTDKLMELSKANHHRLAQ